LKGGFTGNGHVLVVIVVTCEIAKVSSSTDN
jgi:hypothetical protein